MSERLALGIVFVSSLVLITVVFCGLWMLGASVEVIGIGWMLVLIGSSLTAGLVASHYAPSHDRQHEDD